jgi:hypothetical protein
VRSQRLARTSAPYRAPGRTTKFTFERGGRDFSTCDRAVLDILNPHLVQLRRAGESRGRLRAALALHESTEAAVVLLEVDDRIAFARTAARELIDRYFGENGAGLPDSVASWLRERRRTATTEPLRIETGERVGQRQIAVTLDVYTHVMPLDEIPESAYLEVKPSLELDARQQYDTIVTSASRARYPAASRRSVGVLDDRRWQPMPSSKTTGALGANGRNVGFLELGGRACRSRN